MPNDLVLYNPGQRAATYGSLLGAAYYAARPYVGRQQGTYPWERGIRIARSALQLGREARQTYNEFMSNDTARAVAHIQRVYGQSKSSALAIIKADRNNRAEYQRRIGMNRRPSAPHRTFGHRWQKFKVGHTRRTGMYSGKYMASGVQQELKFLDKTHPSADPIPAAGQIIPSILLIPQGDGHDQRIGRKVFLNKIHQSINITLKNVPATQPDGQVSDVVRVIMYMDTQTNGAAATVAMILATATYDAWRNLNNSERFKILYDKTIVLNRAAVVGAAAGAYDAIEISRSIQIHKNLNNMPITYDPVVGVEGTIDEMKQNNIGLLYISKNAECLLTNNSRIRYSG